jgi:membrane associated rhomboid family serine protease
MTIYDILSFCFSSMEFNNSLSLERERRANAALLRAGHQATEPPSSMNVPRRITSKRSCHVPDRPKKIATMSDLHVRAYEESKSMTFGETTGKVNATPVSPMTPSTPNIPRLEMTISKLRNEIIKEWNKMTFLTFLPLIAFFLVKRPSRLHFPLSGTLILLVVMVGLFGLYITNRRYGRKRFFTSVNRLKQGKWSTLFFASLSHFDLRHLLANSLGLAYTGPVVQLWLEHTCGKQLAPVFLVALFVAVGCISIMGSSFLRQELQKVYFIGASGAVFFLQGFLFSAYYQKATERYSTELGLSVGTITLTDEAVNHIKKEYHVDTIAHLIGFLVGAAVGREYRNFLGIPI